MAFEIFTPLADDKLAPAAEVGTEYAVVKSSGYLSPIGVGENAKHHALAYSKSRGGRVIVSRLIGTENWEIVPQTITTVEFTIPDTIPEDFS